MPDETNLSWLSPPPANAPSHSDRSAHVFYAISADITNMDRCAFRKTPLYQVWVHLHNRLPPIPNVSIVERDDATPECQTLHDATACFRGVERPLNDNSEGNNVVTYVLKPKASVAYEPRFGAPIQAREIPDGYVLTVQVVLGDSLQDSGYPVSGVVTRIELVECDPANDKMPKNHSERYGGQLW